MTHQILASWLAAASATALDYLTAKPTLMVTCQ
jgi:hypothetical protein